jgi:hypothetical protein
MNDAVRVAFLVFFASHIPITLIMDGQAVLPSSLYPSSLQQLYAWYCVTFDDTLMMEKPLWLKSMICCELIFQVPFFVWAVCT